jgi:hypothetical protein
MGVLGSAFGSFAGDGAFFGDALGVAGAALRFGELLGEGRPKRSLSELFFMLIPKRPDRLLRLGRDFCVECDAWRRVMSGESGSRRGVVWSLGGLDGVELFDG